MSQIEEQAVELEEFAKAGKPVPDDCKLFRIRIDGEKYLVQQAALTGVELLLLADKDKEEYRIFFKKTCGETQLIPLKTNFSFLNPGVERFVTREIRKVEITINNNIHTIRSGEHLVTRLKRKGGVSDTHVLCQIVAGKPPVELNDNDRVEIEGGEIFASHQPGGAAS